MDGMSDDRLADLPCGELAANDLHGMREAKFTCIFKQGHEGMHFGQQTWGNGVYLWWGNGEQHEQERQRWTA